MTPHPGHSAVNLFAVGAGGAIGAVARYGVMELIGSSDRSAFPWDTLAVNLAGSLLIGLFFRYYLAIESDRRPDLQRLFFATGLLGGFTTFSTLSLDTVDLFRSGAWLSGVIYVAATLIGGLALASFGYGLRRANGPSG